MKLFGWLRRRDRWEVRRTIWPYPDGWGTYNPTTHTIADAGLSREAAEEECRILNEGGYALADDRSEAHS